VVRLLFLLALLLTADVAAPSPARDAGDSRIAATAVADIALGEEMNAGSAAPILLRSGDLRILFRELRTDRGLNRYVARI